MQAQKPFRPTFRFAAALTLNLAVVVLEIISAVMSVSRNGLSLFSILHRGQQFVHSRGLRDLFGLPAALRRDRQSRSRVGAAAEIYGVVLSRSDLYRRGLRARADGGGAEGFKMMLLYDSCSIIICSALYLPSRRLCRKRDHAAEEKPCEPRSRPLLLRCRRDHPEYIAKVIEGPYPFLYVYKQPVYMSVLWCVIILGGAYLIALLLWLTGKKFVKAKPREPDNG